MAFIVREIEDTEIEVGAVIATCSKDKARYVQLRVVCACRTRSMKRSQGRDMLSED